MRKDEAKTMVLDLIAADLQLAPFPIAVDPLSPDPKDPSKFLLGGRVACPIHHFSGWHPKIDLGWFEGGFDEPQVHGFPFYWYVFALPARHGQRRDHYLICDYLQVREWVLDFAAPLGRDHRDHNTWRADLHVYGDGSLERQGYFRWGDEPTALEPRPDRVFELDNIATVHELQLIKERVGTHGPDGESAAHRRLKLYVAQHPVEFGLSAMAEPHVEYRFQTGDRVEGYRDFSRVSPRQLVAGGGVAGVGSGVGYVGWLGMGGCRARGCRRPVGRPGAGLAGALKPPLGRRFQRDGRAGLVRDRGRAGRGRAGSGPGRSRR